MPAKKWDAERPVREAATQKTRAAAADKKPPWDWASTYGDDEVPVDLV